MSLARVLSTVFVEIKKSSVIALPLIIAKIIYDLSGFFSTMMVANIGTAELEAYALVWETFSTFTIFFIGILTATNILVAHSFGANDTSNIRVSFHQGLWLAIIFSPIAMLLVWFGPTILSWTKQDPSIIALATPSFHSLIWAILPLNIMSVTIQFFIGINKAYLVTIMNILHTPIQILLFYIFLFGKLGVPQLGLKSIGLGFTISYYLVLIPMFLYIIYSQQFKIYQLFKNWFQFNIKIIFELIRLGVPLGVVYFSMSAIYTVTAIMMGELGTDALAAYQIYYQYIMIALMVVYALANTAAVRVGIEVGSNNRSALRLAVLVNIVMGLVLMIGFSICYIYFPKLIIQLDSKAAASQIISTKASQFLFIAGILLFIQCINTISTRALRGLKDIKIPMIINIICFWCITMPCAYIFGFYFKFGGVGILWSIVIGTLLAGLILLFRFNQLSKHINLNNLVTKST